MWENIPSQIPDSWPILVCRCSLLKRACCACTNKVNIIAGAWKSLSMVSAEDVNFCAVVRDIHKGTGAGSVESESQQCTLTCSQENNDSGVI